MSQSSSPPTLEKRRAPGRKQSFVLLVAVALSPLILAVVGPTLPRMQEHFASVRGVDYLVPICLTIPTGVMALLSVFAGALADRFGRKRMLITATAFYAVVGTAPMWLDDLPAIMVTRLFVGICDAIIITCSTTLIGDYYEGAKRERLLALQTTVAACSAMAFNIIGGVIGNLGWRAPYGVFGISILLAPLMAQWLWEVRARRAANAAPHAELSSREAPEVLFRPWLLAGICTVTVLVSLAFMVVPVHYAYLLEGLGITKPAQIGLAMAINSFGVIAGNFVFGWIVGPRLRVAHQLALGVAIAGSGFLVMRAATGYPMMVVGAVVDGLGSGFLLPVIATWNMRELPFSHRGLGVGAFQSSFSFGCFINPIVVVGLAHVMGGRTPVVGAFGVLMLIVSAACIVLAGLRPRVVPAHTQE